VNPEVRRYDRAVSEAASTSSQSRRAFNRTLLRVGIALAFLHFGFRKLFGRLAAAAEEKLPTAPEKLGARSGMTIDLDRCTGCGACVVGCRTENNVPFFGPTEEAKGTGIYWMALLPVGGSGELPEHGHADMLPRPCMHCENPACVKVCPTNATYQTEDGVVAQIFDRCIGCRYCQVACPYGVRSFNFAEPQWPESYRSYINPDVATRPKGVVEKCTFCGHRLRDAHERAQLDGRMPRDAELRRLPACAQVCPADAIAFGDLNDPASEVSILASSPRAFRLLEYIGTKPKVIYLGKDRRRT
jgi:molybdopterin-containing oxidoreductase family iron-sulfur binding subunit